MKEAYEHYLAVKAKYPGKTEAGGREVDAALEGLLAAVAVELAKPDTSIGGLQFDGDARLITRF